MLLANDRHWDSETDLLVVGAGAAGMTAALVGALEGLNVILCEKSEKVGGTTATSAGSVWIPGSHQSERAGVPDSIAAAKIYLGGMLGGDMGDERLSAFLASGPVVLDYLERRSSVVFTSPPVHPDYRNLPGAAVGGRALGAVHFDGRQLGCDFDRVRPPRREFMVLGGMMVGKYDIEPLVSPLRTWSNFRHVVKLIGRHVWDRLSFTRGTRLIMGNALVGRLLNDLRRLSVEIRYGTALTELVRIGDRIVGAVLSTPAGDVRVRARNGVVLATGGIGWNEELRNRFLPESARRYSLAPESNTGDGILAGERASGEIDRKLQSPALWMPCSVMKQLDGHLSVFPHIMLDRAKPGLLAVDASGRRFVNEADSYHDFVEAMLRSDRSPASVPSYLVCDRSFIDDYGVGLVHPGTRDLRRFIEAGYLIEGDTIAGLATKIGVNGEALSRTIERYNSYAETGVDEEFGRGTSALNQFNGDPLNKPNPCLRKIGLGPYCAVAVWPADLASSAGLRTDSRGRVLRSDGAPLRGLYAAGTDAASIFRGTYPGPGTMIGPAIVFAWRAAMDAAGALDNYQIPTD
ncbi:FAD-dependent oxidoreductase [Bradyrhizobium erythrophlei]|uniref:Succinate dehydrogenase/fumarate reductase, flavoprotein subunit n=1 Tax=Bradyrhizobium erythrophlei TaxID=1437360 RepID=A0A1M7UDW9_9BRAD|nr:FAD-dependent oxidoreductase [Bradyrhizobium erythrophlei]SHN81060.1 Succinate dehydrogenase/fumarate reductase, flavoprotein subunit [Bradyrhizobium erythrophlei]